MEIELDELTFVAVLAGCTSVASSFAALSSLSAAGSAARRVEARSTSRHALAGLGPRAGWNDDEISLVGPPQVRRDEAETRPALVPAQVEVLGGQHLQAGLHGLGVHGCVEWDGDRRIGGDRDPDALREQRFGRQRSHLRTGLSRCLVAEGDEDGEREGGQRDAGHGSVAAQRVAKRLELGGGIGRAHGPDRTQ
jgi:hypothetical protein